MTCILCRGNMVLSSAETRLLVFALDTETKKWHKLPPLPAPRYAPATQIWRGRLHVMGGSMENRHTPGKDHWSIAVKNGKAFEPNEYKFMILKVIFDRACVVVDDRPCVIGGQVGDFMPKPGSLNFKCSCRHEDRDRKLRIFTGNEHPFGDKALEPFVMPPRQENCVPEEEEQ